MISQPWFNHQWHQRIELAGKTSTGFNVVIILPQNFYLISSSHGPTFTSSTENKDIIFFSVFLVSWILSICLWIDLHLQGNRGKNHKIYRCACRREIQKKIFLIRTSRRAVCAHIVGLSSNYNSLTWQMHLLVRQLIQSTSDYKCFLQ